MKLINYSTKFSFNQEFMCYGSIFTVQFVKLEILSEIKILKSVTFKVNLVNYKVISSINKIRRILKQIPNTNKKKQIEII